MTSQTVENFETERLSAKSWLNTLESNTEKRALAKALLPFLTPDVLTHLPPSLQVEMSLDCVLDWIDARAAESDVYVVREKTSEQIVGLLILVEEQRADTPITLHLGYLFAQFAWGQGYATELISGLLRALKNSAPVRLLGGVALENPASAHILKKLGFSRDPNLSDKETDVFSITIPAL